LAKLSFLSTDEMQRSSCSVGWKPRSIRLVFEPGYRMGKYEQGLQVAVLTGGKEMTKAEQTAILNRYDVVSCHPVACFHAWWMIGSARERTRCLSPQTSSRVVLTCPMSPWLSTMTFLSPTATKEATLDQVCPY
jgi:hypothetical protein